MWLNLSFTLLLPESKKRELSLYGTLGRKIAFLVAQTLDKLGEKARDNGELKKFEVHSYLERALHQTLVIATRLKHVYLPSKIAINTWWKPRASAVLVFATR